MVAANPNAPFGLRAVSHMKGGVIRYNGGYQIADQYATGLFLGDPVVCNGTGKQLSIASAGTGNKITGVFAGCKFVDQSGDSKWLEYWPASQITKGAVGATAYIWDDPDILFEVMFDTLAIGDVRALANLVAGAGSTVTGLSGWSAAHPPGAGENQVKIYEMPTSETNPGGIPNNYGAFAVAQVLIAQHELLLMSNL